MLDELIVCHDRGYVYRLCDIRAEEYTLIYLYNVLGYKRCGLKYHNIIRMGVSRTATSSSRVLTILVRLL